MLRNLDEIYAGVCDGMTYEEIEANYPEEFALRNGAFLFPLSIYGRRIYGQLDSPTAHTFV